MRFLVDWQAGSSLSEQETVGAPSLAQRDVGGMLKRSLLTGRDLNTFPDRIGCSGASLPQFAVGRMFFDLGGHPFDLFLKTGVQPLTESKRQLKHPLVRGKDQNVPRGIKNR